MAIDIKAVQKLREETGAGVMDAKKALVETKGDYKKAIEFLRKQGQKVAVKKQDRTTGEGTIGYYVHANGRVAALVAIACESDFVAKTKDFQNLTHDLAMQVAAADPLYISPEEVPADTIAKEKKIFKEQLKKENKPAKVWDKIVAGKMDKYFSEICLLKQPFIKEEQKTIEQLIQERVMKLGENIQIKEFKRIVL